MNDKLYDFLEKHPRLDDLHSLYKRTSYKIDYFFARKYPITKEHIAAGFTKKDRPLKRFDEFEALTVLSWITYPVLVRFRYNKHQMGHPVDFSSQEEWQRVLDKMIFAFELIIADTFSDKFFDAKQEAVKQGLELYAKYFQNLWD